MDGSNKEGDRKDEKVGGSHGMMGMGGVGWEVGCVWGANKEYWAWGVEKTASESTVMSIKSGLML